MSDEQADMRSRIKGYWATLQQVCGTLELLNQHLRNVAEEVDRHGYDWIKHQVADAQAERELHDLDAATTTAIKLIEKAIEAISFEEVE